MAPAAPADLAPAAPADLAPAAPDIAPAATEGSSASAALEGDVVADDDDDGVSSVGSVNPPDGVVQEAVSEPLFRPGEDGPASFNVNSREYPGDEPEPNAVQRAFLNQFVFQLATQTLANHPALNAFRHALLVLTPPQRVLFLRRFFETAKRVGTMTHPLLVRTGNLVSNIGDDVRPQDAGRNPFTATEATCDSLEGATTQAQTIWVRTLQRSLNDRLFRSRDGTWFFPNNVSVQAPPFLYPNQLTKEMIARQTLSNSQRARWRGTSLVQAGDLVLECHEEIVELVAGSTNVWFAFAVNGL